MCGKDESTGKYIQNHQSKLAAGLPTHHQSKPSVLLTKPKLFCTANYINGKKNQKQQHSSAVIQYFSASNLKDCFLK